MWGGQGNDITSQLERRDWMRKNLTGSSIKDTTSSPASLWGTSSYSSQNPGSSRSSFFGGGSSGQSSGVGGDGQGGGSMWTSGSSNNGGGGQASSAWSPRGTGVTAGARRARVRGNWLQRLQKPFSSLRCKLLQHTSSTNSYKFKGQACRLINKSQL